MSCNSPGPVGPGLAIPGLVVMWNDPSTWWPCGTMRDHFTRLSGMELASWLPDLMLESSRGWILMCLLKKKSVDWPAMLSDAIHFWKHAWFRTLSPAPFISLQNSFMLCNNLSQGSECLRLLDFLTCSFFTFRTKIKLAIPTMIYNIVCMYMCFPICPVLGFPCQATLVWGPNSWHIHSICIV